MPHTFSPELVIRQRVSALGRELAGARSGDVHAVHQARVATRRLREALPLVASGGKARRLARGVRRLTRALGPVRELDVVLQMLEGLATSGRVSRDAAAVLTQLIADERESLHAKAVRRIDGCDLERMRHRAVAAAKRGLQVVPGRGAKTSAKSVAAWQRAARRAERLREATDSAAGIYLPDRLHKVRIAVKKLRYTLEITHQISGARAGRAAGGARSTRSVRGQIAALKRAQDLLGQMHDLEMLIARARAAQSAPAAPNLKLSGELDDLVRGLETECRQLHGHYMASRAQLLDVCDRVAAAAERVSQRTSAA